MVLPLPCVCGDELGYVNLLPKAMVGQVGKPVAFLPSFGVLADGWLLFLFDFSCLFLPFVLLQMVLRYKDLPFKLTPCAPDTKVLFFFFFCLDARLLRKCSTFRISFTTYFFLYLLLC